jgi:26 proteasome complex subunit DSS1
MSSAQPQQQQQKLTEEQSKKNLAQLGALEEDDEFEEFAAEGRFLICQNVNNSSIDLVTCIDWGENEEDQNDAHFWEDNWDDDDVEDDFSKQLR